MWRTCVDQFEHEIQTGRIHYNVLQFDDVGMLELPEQNDFSKGGGGNSCDEKCLVESQCISQCVDNYTCIQILSSGVMLVGL